MDEIDEEEGGIRLFPIGTNDLVKFRELSKLIRRRLWRFDAREICASSAVIVALDRLPRTTSWVAVNFGFQTTLGYGNWSWASIQIWSDEIVLSVGEHYYDADVGGDTKSENLFESYAGGTECYGSVENWMEKAELLLEKGSPQTNEDESDYSNADWDLEGDES